MKFLEGEETVCYILEVIFFPIQNFFTLFNVAK